MKKTSSLCQVFFFLSTASAMLVPGNIVTHFEHVPAHKTAAFELDLTEVIPNLIRPIASGSALIPFENQFIAVRDSTPVKMLKRIVLREKNGRLPAAVPANENRANSVRRDDAGLSNNVRRDSLAAFAEAATNAAEEIYRENRQRFHERREQILQESAKIIGVIEED